jgi:putative tryptophan/tyrosine transport system substrate-binding protein
VIAALLALAAAAAPPVAVVVSDDVPAYAQPAEAALAALADRASAWRIRGRELDGNAVGARLAADPPEVVLAFGAKAAWIARRYLPDTPLVYAGVRDPARYGVVGSRVTGVQMGVAPETFLSQFVSFFPDAGTIGVLLGPGTSAERERALTRAAEEVGVKLVPQRVAAAREVRGALHRAPALDALWMIPDTTLLSPNTWRSVLEETQRRRIPLLVDTTVLVRAGGAFAVVPDPDAVAAAAVAQVERLLAGELPSDVEVATAEGRLVAVNVRALEQVGADFDPLLRDFVDVLVP